MTDLKGDMSPLYALVAKLPPSLQPYAKALVPVAVAASAAASSYLVTGTLDTGEVVTALSGAVTSLLVLAVPNA